MGPGTSGQPPSTTPPQATQPPPAPRAPAPTGGFGESPSLAIPAGARVYDGSTSLTTALKSLPAGGFLVLQGNWTRRESVSVAFADNVTVYAPPGNEPWLDGPLRISGGRNWRVIGLNNRWTSPDPQGHMVKLDGGSGFYGYNNVDGSGGGMYTLVRPGQSLTNTEIAYNFIHDNPGVSGHGGQQDHGLYVDVDSANSGIRIHHNLVQNMPRGRDIKIGKPSSGGSFGGVEVDHNTLRTGYGPSNGQVSNGASNTVWHHNVLIDSGASTSLTDGPGSGGGNVYRDNASDRPTGPDTSAFRDAGGNVQKSVGELSDYAGMGRLGYGHLAG